MSLEKFVNKILKLKSEKDQKANRTAQEATRRTKDAEKFIKSFQRNYQDKIHPRLNKIRTELAPVFNLEFKEQAESHSENTANADITVIPIDVQLFQVQKVQITLTGDAMKELFTITYQTFRNPDDGHSENTLNHFEGDSIEFSEIDFEKVFEEILDKSFVNPRTTFH